MLNQIHIRDLATIEELNLNLQRGCTMITGETGAGKSIFIEAIELALGSRASATLVRPGKEKADISLCFDVSDFPRVIERLKNLDLYQDSSECIIRRVITNDGRSRCFVNGVPTPAGIVKELGELLFHLHSQHEQQVLLKLDTQREMLDRYADHLPLAIQVRELAEQWKSINQQIKSLQEKKIQQFSQLEYFQFQLDELNHVDLKSGEWESLEAEHRRLTHAEELIKNIHLILQQINDDDRNLNSIFHDIKKTLESVQSMDNKINDWINLIDSCCIQVTELSSELQNYIANIEVDPDHLKQLEDRVSLVFNLARKHKISPQELIPYKQTLEKEIQNVFATDQEIQALEKQKQIIEKRYHECSILLSQSRAQAAEKFEKQITTIMQSLSLPHCLFKIALESETTNFALHGKEKIIFLIKTNPDQPLLPLNKDTISGGELSRLSLAAHLSLAHRTTIPTLVFDEVDTGLSGATAEKIGKLLQKLGHSYQVFCITHQAQVAAYGHHHLLVEKNFIGQITHTRLRILDTEEKTREIARLLGGEKITEKTLEHAKEVLQGI